MIEMIGIAVLLYGFREPTLASEEWKIGAAYAFPIILFFLMALTWNLFSIPAERKRVLKDEIASLQPDVADLTAHQWAILRACKLGNSPDEHWMHGNGVGNCQIDGAEVRPSDGKYYSYDVTQSQLQYLERRGLLEIVYFGQTHASFILTSAASAMLRKTHATSPA